MSEPMHQSYTPQPSVSLDPATFVDRFSTDGDEVIIASGEIDLYTAPKLWEALARLIERGHREMVVDMGGVEFMDSQGIAAIVRAQKHLAATGGTVVVRAPRPQARTVLELTGLDGALRIED